MENPTAECGCAATQECETGSCLTQARARGLHQREIEVSARFIVRGFELYEAVVELADQVGIELEDG